MHIIRMEDTQRVYVFILRACTGFDGGLEAKEAIRSGTLR